MDGGWIIDRVTLQLIRSSQDVGISYKNRGDEMTWKKIGLVDCRHGGTKKCQHVEKEECRTGGILNWQHVGLGACRNGSM